jgi:hypothetical protein
MRNTYMRDVSFLALLSTEIRLIKPFRGSFLPSIKLTDVSFVEVINKHVSLKERRTFFFNFCKRRNQ